MQTLSVPWYGEHLARLSGGGGGWDPHTAILESKRFHLISFPPHTYNLLFIKFRCITASLNLYRYFMVTAFLNSLLHLCSPLVHPYDYLMEELARIDLFSLSLVNCEIASEYLHFYPKYFEEENTKIIKY